MTIDRKYPYPIGELLDRAADGLCRRHGCDGPCEECYATAKRLLRDVNAMQIDDIFGNAERGVVTSDQIAIRETLAIFINDSPCGALFNGLAVADELLCLFPGLRVVGDDEVVVTRSSIRQGWLILDKNGRWDVYDQRPVAHLHPPAEHVGVIPWPPEASS